MIAVIKSIAIIVILTANLNCTPKKQDPFKAEEVYKSSTLIITRISENSFQHTSFLQTNDFGKVPCNGLVVRSNNETVVFDTPTSDSTSEELIKWIKESLQCRINAVIPTHFHNDCLAGLKAFDKNGIPSYAYFKTIELAKANNYNVPGNSFNDSLVLKLGDKHVTATFFGEGHTKDNVVGYFPAERIMFGGCLLKELNANKGFLGDASVAAWPGTVEKIKKEYPNVKIIIPGHGAYGDSKLLDYTIDLFRKPS